MEDVEVEPQSKSQKTIQDDEVALEFEENFSAPKRTGSDMVAKSPDDGLETYGFYQPPKLRRKLPLQEKGVDPSLCHDILDDLYAFYFDMEVVIFSLTLNIIHYLVCRLFSSQKHTLIDSRKSHLV